MNVEWMDLENLANQRNLVAFRLDRQAYALPVEPIVQIIEMVTITPIPQVSHTVEGVINVRGAPVPVVNLRRHLGLPAASLQLHTPIILAQVGEQRVGLIVDEVMDVLSLPGGQITHPADILPEGLGEAPILQGLAYTQNDTVLLLDPEHLFLPHQVQALAQATAALPEMTEPVPSPALSPVEGADEGKEASEEPPVETEPQPARRRRKKSPRAQKATEAPSVETKPEAAVEKAAEESPAETEPQPARRRRKKRQRTKKASKETPLDESDPEVGA